MQTSKSLIALSIALSLLAAGCNNEPDTPEAPGSAQTSSPAPVLSTDRTLPASPSPAEDQAGLFGDPDRQAFEKVIPEINAETIQALRRQSIAQKKVLVIHCWSTQSQPARALFPALQQAVEARSQNAQIISLNLDKDIAQALQAQAFLTEHNAWNNAYRATQAPSTKNAMTQALSDTWDGETLPAVFIYAPDTSAAKAVFELTQTPNNIQDATQTISQAIDNAMIQ